jgi:capsid protein
MGKVKAFFMDMEDDAKTMTEKDFVNKYGEQYQYIWRNEQIWIESNKKKGIEQDRDPDEGHEMWEGGG